MSKNKSKKDKELEQWLRYEGMRDKALAMAYTLREIDRELHFAAQSEGNYPGAYKSENLLANLCKIMYASEGYHQEYDMLDEAERKRRNKCNL